MKVCTICSQYYSNSNTVCPHCGHTLTAVQEQSVSPRFHSSALPLMDALDTPAAVPARTQIPDDEPIVYRRRRQRTVPVTAAAVPPAPVAAAPSPAAVTQPAAASATVQTRSAPIISRRRVPTRDERLLHLRQASSADTPNTANDTYVPFNHPAPTVPMPEEPHDSEAPVNMFGGAQHTAEPNPASERQQHGFRNPFARQRSNLTHPRNSRLWVLAEQILWFAIPAVLLIVGIVMFIVNRKWIQQGLVIFAAFWVVSFFVTLFFMRRQFNVRMSTILALSTLLAIVLILLYYNVAGIASGVAAILSPLVPLLIIILALVFVLR